MKNLLVLLGITLAGFSCGENEDSLSQKSAELKEPFTIKYGQSAEIDPIEMMVTFSKVKEDSRCPSSVQCVWEGRAVVEVKITQGSGSVTDFLATQSSAPTPADSMIAFNRVIKLLEVTPYPITPNSLEEKDYKIKLVVY